MSLIDDTLADQLEASLAGMPAREPLAQRPTEAPVERDPDDFKRRTDGTPYVSDPSGATVKSGPRKDEPCWALYGRPSGFGQQIENTYNLRKWTERRIVLGIGNDPRLSEGVRSFCGADPEDAATKDELDGFVVKALRSAKAGLAAEQGTHGHELTEDAEAGDDEASWIGRAERGRALGLPIEVQAAMVEAWRQSLTHYSLEVLASESKVVHDGYRQAGSLDRIVRLHRPLTFNYCGTEVTLPAGTVLVLDTKTGKLKLRKDGSVSGYWNGYAVQIAVYVGARPYDTRTETRGDWPFEINQKWALIAHLPVDEALAGKAACRLVLVDIERGRYAADLCLAAKEWEDEQVFALGGTDVIVPVAQSTATTAPVVAEAAQPVAVSDAGDGLTAALDERRLDLQRRAQLLTTAERKRVLDEVAAQALPSLLAPRTADELDRWATLLDTVEADRPKAYEPPVATAAAPPPELAAQYDRAEGGPVSADDAAALMARYQKLGDRQAWVNAISIGARMGGHELSMNAKFGGPTLRRFEALRGLVILAEHDGCAEDAVVRALGEAVHGTEAAQHPAITVGQVVGVMGPAEARAFAVLAQQLVDGDLDLTVENVGQPDEVCRVVRP